LSRTSLDRGQRVRDGQPQIVVAVHGDRRALDVGDVLTDVGDHHPELVGLGEATRVGDVDGCRARLDDRFQHLAHVRPVRPRGVHRRELDVFGIATRALHHLDGAVLGLLAAQPELRLQVNVGGREEGVDARPLGGANRFPALVDVRGHCPGEAGDDRSAYLTSNRLHRGEIVGARGGEAGFDDVHAEPRELLRQRQLLRGRQRKAWRLLAVTQRGVEEFYERAVLSHSALTPSLS